MRMNVIILLTPAPPNIDTLRRTCSSSDHHWVSTQYPPSSSDHHWVSTPVPTLLIRPPLGQYPSTHPPHQTTTGTVPQYPPSSSDHHWVSTPISTLLIRPPLGQYSDRWADSVGGAGLDTPPSPSKRLFIAHDQTNAKIDSGKLNAPPPPTHMSVTAQKLDQLRQLQGTWTCPKF